MAESDQAWSGSAAQMSAIEAMLQERYRDDPHSAAVAREAARLAPASADDLEDRALAWHLAHNAERDAAAALSGAVAAAARTLSEAELLLRTRLNRFTVHQLAEAAAPPARS